MLVLLWVLALSAVLLFPLMFPTSRMRRSSARRCSKIARRSISGPLHSDNPFNSLANNVVPAVVLFSVIMGVALIPIPEKARLLDVLAVAATAMSKPRISW